MTWKQIPLRYKPFMIMTVSSSLPFWFDELSEGVLLVQAGRVVACNAAAGEMLGIAAAAAVGVPLIGVLRDHRLEGAYTSGEPVEVEMRGRVLRAAPVAGGLSLRDLTGERRAQDNARELLAVLSHELRTPVSIIRSTFEALAGDIPDKLRVKFLARAQTEGDRLVRLLEDLTVDVKPPQYRRVLLPEVAGRAVNLVQRRYAEHGVKLSVDISPLTVWADEDKLLQVLINLLENAAVHGPDNAAVTLSAEADYDTAMARICVRDEGVPLGRDTVERLFEPHARGRSVKAKGTGLGLYIVRNIAAAWGGAAWGKPLAAGNEFGVTVPLKPSIVR